MIVDLMKTKFEHAVFWNHMNREHEWIKTKLSFHSKVACPLPIRVVKIGSDNRPATKEDIAEIHRQLEATANDPNLTIVSENWFQYEYEKD